MLGKLETIMRASLQLKLPEEGLTEQQRLNEDLRIDSIMLLQLIVLLEQELQVRVPEEEVDAKVFATVGSLLDFVGGMEVRA